MTQDEIIRMAREAGLEIGVEFIAGHKTNIERFAALVAAHAKSEQINLAYQQGYEEGSAHEREKQPEHFAKAIAELVECCRVLAEENEAAVLAEREACAKVCDDKHDYMCSRAAAAIRARGENGTA